MEGFAFGTGLLLATFGPLLLLLPLWGVNALLRRAGIPERLGLQGRRAAITRWGVALAVVGGVVLAGYLPGRLEFERLCEALAEPRIHARTAVDGFFLDDPTADSFGLRYVGEEGFAWFETADIYRRGAYVRYRRSADGVQREPAGELQGRHVVEQRTEERPWGIAVSSTRIIDRTSGGAMAEAHSITYHGGPPGLVLGVYGFSQCPDPRSAEGSRQFNSYYHLARLVLGNSR